MTTSRLYTPFKKSAMGRFFWLVWATAFAATLAGGGCYSQMGYQAAAGYPQAFPRATDRGDIGVRVIRVRAEVRK